MAKEIEHKDILGNPILMTSKLAVARHNRLVVCSIVKITSKMLRVKPINAGEYYRGDGYLAYPDNCIVVDGPDVMAYVLRGNNGS